MSDRRRESFKGRAAIVTGAASGIGLALCRQLAEVGGRVLLVARDEVALQRAVTAITDAGGTAHGHVADVTDEGAVRAAVERVIELHGRVDYIFNNAGIGVGGEVMDLDSAQWRRIIDVNLFGVIHGVRAAWPADDTLGDTF